MLVSLDYIPRFLPYRKEDLYPGREGKILKDLRDSSTTCNVWIWLGSITICSCFLFFFNVWAFLLSHPCVEYEVLPSLNSLLYLIPVKAEPSSTPSLAHRRKLKMYWLVLEHNMAFNNSNFLIVSITLVDSRIKSHYDASVPECLTLLMPIVFLNENFI